MRTARMWCGWSRTEGSGCARASIVKSKLFKLGTRNLSEFKKFDY